MKIFNAQVLDGTGAKPIKDAVLVFDGRLKEIGAAADLAEIHDPESLDAGGRMVIPGLINAHAHIVLDSNNPDTLGAIGAEPPAVTAIRAARRVQRMLQAGITTAAVSRGHIKPMGNELRGMARRTHPGEGPNGADPEGGR